jgi:hypothetical protein
MTDHTPQLITIKWPCVCGKDHQTHGTTTATPGIAVNLIADLYCPASPDVVPSAGYHLTHIPTGCSIAPWYEFDTPEAAESAAALLGQLGWDWTTLGRPTRGVAKAATEALEESDLGRRLPVNPATLATAEQITTRNQVPDG